MEYTGIGINAELNESCLLWWVRFALEKDASALKMLLAVIWVPARNGLHFPLPNIRARKKTDKKKWFR